MMDLALEEIVGGTAPPDLSERIALAARRSVSEQSPRRAQRLAASILLAASLLVGAFVLWKILSTPNRPPTPPGPAPAQYRQPEQAPPAPEPGALERLADEMEKGSREGDPDLLLRADAFLKTVGSADAIALGRFKAALCYRSDASARWAKNPKDPEVPEGFRRAEQTLVKVLAVQGGPARDLVQHLARYELASLYMHPAMSQPARAQEFLDLCLKAVPERDPWLARVWAAQVRCALDAKGLGPAADALDRLLERFPEGPQAARMSKMVAIRLDEATSDLIRTGGQAAQIEKNLRRMSKYYAAWLNLGPIYGLKITPADVLSVSDSLYMTARRLNRLGDEVTSVVDLRGSKVAEPGLFKDAAFVMALALGTPMAERERLVLGARRARCLGFAARDPGGWRDARDGYQELLEPFKLVQANGTLDPQVLVAHRELFELYIELGSVYLELGKRAPGRGPAFDEASKVFSNVLRVAQAETEPWWFSKYMVLAVLYERRDISSLKLSKVGMENLERSYPDFDGGKFSMKDRFVELKKKIDEEMGK
jgi:hypothetical protein